jgi:2-polyprenyl-3-methyl-5-hydroxy-6-metoxy-1,4-benzoquinol methylase
MTTKSCPVCKLGNIKTHYTGAIRNGKFPNIVDSAIIYKCVECTIEYLSNYHIDYKSTEYRQLVDSSHTAEGYYDIHDNDQYAKLQFFDLKDLRGKKILDLGSGAGAFLDLVKGYVSESYAIEPATYYHQCLREKGHKVYESTDDLLLNMAGQFDYIVSFSVIEHVDDPISFVDEATRLLKPGGTLIISTPNANDVLLKLLPDSYPSFFYRVVHKWYFTKKSLSFVAENSGLDFKIVHKHRFGLSNLLAWMNYRKPNTSVPIEFSDVLEATYKSELEKNGQADYLYLIASK